MAFFDSDCSKFAVLTAENTKTAIFLGHDAMYSTVIETYEHTEDPALITFRSKHIPQKISIALAITLYVVQKDANKIKIFLK